MIIRQFTSFEDINRELQILQLQRQIDAEHLKLTFEKGRSNLYPTHLLGGIGGIVKKFLFTVVLKKVVDRLH